MSRIFHKILATGHSVVKILIKYTIKLIIEHDLQITLDNKKELFSHTINDLITHRHNFYKALFIYLPIQNKGSEEAKPRHLFA